MNSVPVVMGRVQVKRRTVSEPGRVEDVEQIELERIGKPMTMGANSAYSYTKSPPLYIKPAPYSRLTIPKLTPSPEADRGLNNTKILANMTNLGATVLTKPQPTVIQLSVQDESSDKVSEEQFLEESTEIIEQPEDPQLLETDLRTQPAQESESHTQHTENDSSQTSSSFEVPSYETETPNSFFSRPRIPSQNYPNNPPEGPSGLREQLAGEPSFFSDSFHSYVELRFIRFKPNDSQHNPNIVHPYAQDNFERPSPSSWLELFQEMHRSIAGEHDLGILERQPSKQAVSMPQNSSNSILPSIDSNVAVFTSDYISANQVETPEAVALNRDLNQDLMETIRQHDNFFTSCFTWMGC